MGEYRHILNMIGVFIIAGEPRRNVTEITYQICNAGI